MGVSIVMKNSLQFSEFSCIPSWLSLADLLCLHHEYLPGLVLGARKPAEYKAHALPLRNWSV